MLDRPSLGSCHLNQVERIVRDLAPHHHNRFNLLNKGPGFVLADPGFLANGVFHHKDASAGTERVHKGLEVSG